MRCDAMRFDCLSDAIIENAVTPVLFTNDRCLRGVHRPKAVAGGCSQLELVTSKYPLRDIACPLHDCSYPSPENYMMEEIR